MTVTPPHATMKSAKKRARQEVEEDETRISAGTTPSQATKRQNLSKTPVRMQTTPKVPPKSSGDTLLTPPSTRAKHVGVPAVTDILPPRTAALYMNQNKRNNNNSKNSYSEEKANNLLEPPASPPVAPTQGGPRELPTSPDKRGAESLINRGMSSSSEEQLQVPQAATVDEAASSRYAGIGILILVILLALVSGLWTFERMSSQITIGALQQDLQNCRALHSQDRKQDEYYVKELETEMRVWRQDAKAKSVELEALRTECQLSKESTGM